MKLVGVVVFSICLLSLFVGLLLLILYCVLSVLFVLGFFLWVYVFGGSHC